MDISGRSVKVGDGTQRTTRDLCRFKMRPAITYEDTEGTMQPQNTIDLDATTANQTLRLIDTLEDNDDMLEVYANFDISDEVMAEVAG